MAWYNEGTMTSQSYTCGYCGNVVASNKGFHHAKHGDNRVYICPHCEKPTYLTLSEQIPGVAPGNDVKSLPNDIDSLYREARNSVAASAYTASVLVCRKLLMNIAVSEGAEENKSFLFYVEYLANNGYVPPKGKGWVDHIRKKGNEANHEIKLMTLQDS